MAGRVEGVVVQLPTHFSCAGKRGRAYVSASPRQIDSCMCKSVFSLYNSKGRRYKERSFNTIVISRRKVSPQETVCGAQATTQKFIWLVATLKMRKVTQHIGACSYNVYGYTQMCMGSGIPSTDKIYQTSIPLPAKAWCEMVAPALGLSIPESKSHQTTKLEMPQKFFHLSLGSHSMSLSAWSPLCSRCKTFLFDGLNNLFRWSLRKVFRKVSILFSGGVVFGGFSWLNWGDIVEVFDREIGATGSEVVIVVMVGVVIKHLKVSLQLFPSSRPSGFPVGISG